jgi:hypothetical protein
MRWNRYVALLFACAAFTFVVATGCGSDEGEGGGGAAGTEETGATEGAKKIDPALMEGAKGEVVYCVGKDTTGELKD